MWRVDLDRECKGAERDGGALTSLEGSTYMLHGGNSIPRGGSKITSITHCSSDLSYLCVFLSLSLSLSISLSLSLGL